MGEWYWVESNVMWLDGELRWWSEYEHGNELSEEELWSPLTLALYYI
jgi:hypothetical protein